MQLIDYAIVVAYLAALASLGLVLARRAGQSADHYFLGNRAMPWWMLGASGMASNLDVAGTMAIVALLYQYGLHGFFIEFRGGVVLPIAVFMAFMGKWHRRSGVMTTAEWMLLRFGEGRQGRLARLTAAGTYLVLTIAMTAFFFTAGGQFLAEFLPFTALQCTFGMAAVALAYTLLGGLYGVVWTDVLQAGIIGAAALYVGYLGARELSPELLAQWPAHALNSVLPAWSDAGLGQYQHFGWFLLVWAGKGILEGLGGSGGSAYMAQRYYAARSDLECQKIGMLWTILFAFRWPMVLGFALLALSLGVNPATDAERVLPVVLNSDHFPAGVRGLMLAAILAAAMSTFDSTVNAGAAYVVKDVYQPLRGAASDRELVWIGYTASVGIVGAGLGIALAASASVLHVWVSIVMLLFPAFLVPFALRWYWARLNGAGFASGIVGGFIASAVVALARPADWNEAVQFGVIAMCSALASVGTALLTRPVPSSHLRAFYERVRPFGTWPRAWRTAGSRESRRDLARLAVGLVWQVLTFLLPMALLLGQGLPSLVLALAWLLLTGWLVRDLRLQQRPTASGIDARAELASR